MNVVLDIIKKNLLSIVCGLIALLAVGAWFVWPIPGMFGELATQLEGRRAELESLQTLAKKERRYPQVELAAAEAKKLDVFPTQAVIDAGERLTKSISEQGNQIKDLAAQMNEHKPLVEGVLPSGQNFKAYEYMREYKKALRFADPDPNFRSQSLAIKVLRAGMPPSVEQTEAERARRKAEINANKRIPGVNDAAVDKEIAEMEANITEDLKRETAEQSLIYINADSLDEYPGIIDNPQPPNAALIYLSQIGLWVQQDVAAGLAAANSKSPNVMQAPVKHLIKIDVNEEAARTAAQVMSGDESGTTSGSATATRRISNDVYNVIPFRLTINVDAAKVPDVLTELSRNKFITVLKVDMVSVNAGAELLNGYYYGETSVVQLTMDCEALFLKSWLSKYTPQSLAGAPTQQ